MASSSQSSIAVPIFSGENYDFWSIKLKTYFVSQDLWDITETGVDLDTTANLTEEQQTQLKEKKQKNAKALYTLQSAVDDTIFPRIMGATTAKEAWTKLKEEFQGNEKVRTIKLQTLRRDLENITMKDSETTKNFYSRVKDIVNQMSIYGEVFADKKLVEKILISLSEKYDPIVTAIEESKDIKTLSVTELMGSLEAYEQRLSRRNKAPIESAFQSKLNFGKSQKSKEDGGKSKGNYKGDKLNNNWVKRETGKKNFPPCKICEIPNHRTKDCWHKGKPKCDNCKRFGHIAKYCRAKKNFHANYHEEEKEEEAKLFYARQTSSEEKNETWYVDSGCTNHMTGDERILCDIDTSKKALIILGNGELIETKGKGTIAVQTKKGTKFIRNVFLVPSLKTSLLSVVQMVENGYSLYFADGLCFIYDRKKKNQIIATVKMQNRNFPLHWNYVSNTALKVEVEDSWLWHRRFGHFNFHALKILQQKNMIRDMPCIQEISDVCEGCQLGKQHRLSFPHGQAWRGTAPLELMHTDVFGPMRTPSLYQSRYFILFIDDFTRMTWVYFLHERSEVFTVFQKFKNLVEKQSGHYLKVLRSDRGTE